MRVRRLAGAVCLTGLILSGCSGAGAPPAAEAPAGVVSAQEERQLNAYAERCENRMDDEYQKALIHYPNSMTATMDRASAYVAALDLRISPPPPGQVIHAEDGVTERISVKCVVAARVTPVGTDVEVAPGSEWQYQEWSPIGVVKFAWSVTPSTPNDGELQLDVRPAVKGHVADPSIEPIATYITDVSVEASTIQELWYWTQTEWKLLAAVLATFGGALLLLLRRGAEVVDAVRNLLQRLRGNATETTHAPSAPTAPPTDKTASSSQ